ncbi:MAG: Lrp/AsnC family transcriptional regulator [Oceanospirillaceae bacterium]
MENLDKTDKLILGYLQQDNTLSASDIADKVGLSQSPCWRRINKMQEQGIICGGAATLDRKKLGLKVVVIVNVKLTAHGWSMLNEFEDAIVAFSEVLECWTISGGMDFMLRVVTKDIDSYEQFLRHKLLQLPHIQEAQSHFTMTEVKNTTELPLDIL